jgi:hypothetical protein
VQLKNHKDLLSGLLFMLAGVAFAWTASRYSVGNAEHMGPGYLPVLLGVLLSLLGGLLVFKALVFETEDGGRVRGWSWRALLAVLLANLLFGALLGGLAWLGLPPMGLLIAVFVLVLVASRAVPAMRWKEVLALALLLAGAGYLVFVLLLGLPLALWPRL